jgi:hypothetical protein
VNGGKTKQTDIFYHRVINLNERSKDYHEEGMFNNQYITAGFMRQ